MKQPEASCRETTRRHVRVVASVFFCAAARDFAHVSGPGTACVQPVPRATRCRLRPRRQPLAMPPPVPIVCP
eukprot:352542-Chlamydomonas_euryale.AAC.10